MSPLKFNEIKGNWATLVLPMNVDNSIDYSALSYEIDLLISMGVDGIYSNGSAGEFFNQTENEFDKCSELLADKCNAANLNFQIGVSHMSPIISLNRLKRTKALKPSAVQIILPDWFVPTMDESIVFLKKMQEESAGRGLILYNPPHAKMRLNLAQISDLKTVVPGIVGIKVAGGDASWYIEARKITKHLSVFIPGHFLATGISHGAHGAYSNMACLNPLAAQRWYNMAIEDLDSALELEKRINSFMSHYIAPLITEQKYSNMALDKFLVLLGDWIDINPRLRWPYKGVDPNLVKKIRPFAEKLIPEFFNVS